MPQVRRVADPPEARRSGLCAGLGAIACATAAISAADGRNAAAVTPKEPRLQFQLQVEGKSVPVRLDQPFEVEIGGKKTKMTLTVKPYRVFDAAGVRFRYPRHHTFEVTPDAPPQWWLNGSDNTIMLMSLDKPNAATKTMADFMDGFLNNLPPGAKTTEPSKATIRLQESLIQGNRIVLRVAGTNLRQDAFALAHRGGTYLLVFQDTLRDDGTLADESVGARKMFETSFEFRE